MKPISKPSYIQSVESTLLFRFRFLEVGCFLTGAITILAVVIRYYAQSFPLNLFLANLFLGFVVLFNGFLVRKSKNVVWPSSIFILSLLLIGVNSYLSYGGFYAPAVATISLCPLFAGILGGRKFSAIYISITLMTLILLYWGGSSGLIPVKDPSMELGRFIVYFSISLGLFFTGLSMEAARRFTEKELLKNEIQIRTILESSAVGTIVTDKKFKILLINQKAKDVLQALKLQKPFEEFVSEMINDHIQNQTETSTNSNFGISHAVHFEDFGEPHRIRFKILNFSFNSFTEKSILINLIDETDALRAEEMQKALTTKSKMAALGEMASGIAHEINNPLAIILGKCTVLTRNIQNQKYDSERTIAEIEKIATTSGRIAKIVSGLLNFAREGKVDEYSEVTIGSLIENTLSICSERFLLGGVHLTCQIKVNPDLKIECHPSQISQVLVNLLNNSYDELTTNPIFKDKNKWVRLEVSAQDPEIEINVIDAGFGLSNEIKDKIFNPFFTTKPVGSGTGLGLSISKGLIEKHGGVLTYGLDPINKTNTCFAIRLPQQNHHLKSISPD